MIRTVPERKNDFAVAPYAVDIIPLDPNETNSVTPHATNVVAPEQQMQEKSNDSQK